MKGIVLRVVFLLLCIFSVLLISALLVGNSRPDYMEFNYVSPDMYHDIPVLTDSERNLNLSLRLPCITHPTINRDRTIIGCAIDQGTSSVTVQLVNISLDERVQLWLDLITGETIIVDKPMVNVQYKQTKRAYFVNLSSGSESVQYLYNLEGSGYISVYLDAGSLSDVAIHGCVKGICSRYTLASLKMVGS